MKEVKIKRKILKDRNFPNPPQINKYQDFGRVHKNFSFIKNLTFKKMSIWGGAFLLAGIAGVILLNSKKAAPIPGRIDSQPIATVSARIQPPVPGSENPFTTYRVSAKNGGVIHYPTGSFVKIPGNAFFKKDGTVVSDSVDIKYREFHDPLEIFLSGIPMHYDSGGVKNTLESAGMLQILAFDKGVSLGLNDKSPILVNMASNNNASRFNIYELDTLKNNWIFRGKDKVRKMEENRQAMARKQFLATENKDHITIKPEQANPQKYNFKIGYDKNEFPELAAYENVMFEVTDDGFKPAYYKINWNKISLYNGDEKGAYIVKLKKADTTISVTAKPVFEGQHYNEALARFEEKHKQSGKDRDEKEMEKQAALSKVNKDLSQFNQRQVIVTATNMLGLLYSRSFAIRQLGIHNVDYPIPPLLQYAYSFTGVRQNKRMGEAGDDLNYSTIFLIEKGKNTVFRFAKGEPVRCDPRAKNLMWTLTDKNQVAFFRIADYTRLANGKENNIRPILARNQESAFEEIKGFTDVNFNP